MRAERVNAFEASGFHRFDADGNRWDGNQGEAPTARLRPRRATTWEGKQIPERRWLVRGLIPARNVTILYGDGGTGKSLLAEQLAVSVAGRRTWLQREVCEHGPVIYLSAEDEEDELHRRAADIIGPLALRFSDLPDLHVASLAGEDALLAHEEGALLEPSPLLRELHALAAALQPRLIVLDTIADLYPANENDRAKVRAFITLLRGVALTHDCAVLLLGHPSLTGMSSGAGTSGSTAWSNSARARLYLERELIEGTEADADVRVLTGKKAQVARVGETIRLRYKDGTFTPISAAASGQNGAAFAKRVFLDLLARFTAQGRFVNAKTGVNYAPTIFAGHPDAQGITKRAFAIAMNQLFDEKTVEVRTRRENGRDVNFVGLFEHIEGDGE